MSGKCTVCLERKEYNWEWFLFYFHLFCSYFSCFKLRFSPCPGGGEEGDTIHKQGRANIAKCVVSHSTWEAVGVLN